MRSVVDRNCESHEVKGLFVGDASLVPRTLSVKPSLTVMALATRLAEHLGHDDHVAVAPGVLHDLEDSVLAVSYLYLAAELEHRCNDRPERLLTVVEDVHRDARGRLWCGRRDGRSGLAPRGRCDDLVCPFLPLASLLCVGLLLRFGQVAAGVTIPYEFPPDPAATPEIASINFTSGSTGTPKGVVLTQQNIPSNIQGLTMIFHLRHGDVIHRQGGVRPGGSRDGQRRVPERLLPWALGTVALRTHLVPTVLRRQLIAHPAS